MDAQKVTSLPELIQALGGPAAMARTLGTSPQQVIHWKNSGRMPARLFLRHSRLLSKRGIVAPPSLWAFAPEQEAVEQ